MINYTLNEINNILIKEGIRSNALRKYGKLIKTVSDKIPVNLSILSEPLSIEEIEKNIEKDINKLNKKIFIIVDNVERIIEEPKKVDILGFLHKIFELKDENINIIVLADSSKLIKERITKEYLEKFFINRIELKSLDKYEILDAFLSDNKITTKQFEYIESVYKELDEKIEHLKKEEKKTAFLNMVLKEWESLNKYLETPRNIEHIIARIEEKNSQDKKIISKKYNFDEVEYLKTIILVEVYRSVINENALGLTSENLLKGFSKANSKDEVDFYNYFLTITFFWKKLNELTSGNKYYEMKARAIIKLIHNFENSEEEQIIKKVEYLSIEKLAKHATNVDDYISDFIKYAEYLDSKEISEIIYKNILWYAMSFLKDKSLVLNPIIFELDRENSRSEKSILDVVNFNIGDKDRIEELLIESYREDFAHYLRIKYDYSENIDYIKQTLKSICNKDKEVCNSAFDLIREITIEETDKKYEYIINEFKLLLSKFDSIAYENYYNIDVPFSEIMNQYKQWETSLQVLEKNGTLENFRKELDEYEKTSNLILKNLNEFWKIVATNINIIDIKESKTKLDELIKKIDKKFYKDIKNFYTLSQHDSVLQELSDEKNYLKILDSEIIYKLMNKESNIKKSLIDKIKQPFKDNNQIFHSIKYSNPYVYDEEIINEFNKLYEDFKEENFYFQVVGLNVVFKELKKELKEDLKEELKDIIDEELFNKIKISLIELIDSNRMNEINEYSIEE